MSIATATWVLVGQLADVPRQGARCVVKGDKTIAVFRTIDDQVYALEDKCPHKAGPLSQGIVHDGCVTCPLHNWVISLATGEAQGADKGVTQSIPTKLENNNILVDLSDFEK